MKPSNSHRPSIRRRAPRGTDLWRALVDPDQDLSARRRVLGDLLLAYPGRLTIIYFIMLVVIATVLLTLPVSSRSPGSTDPLTAFYTAVSALSTCGIPIVNSTEHWSVFGQCVILVSVQLGGLGVMTFASLIMLATARHLRASQRLRTANELGASALGETRDVLAVVFATTFIIEGITFAALFPGLFSINKGDWGQTAWEALFYAVSAYNNTGFTPDAAGLHVNNPAVGLPILLSAFCGTLGFPVLLNLARACRHRIPPRRWQLAGHHVRVGAVFPAVVCGGRVEQPAAVCRRRSRRQDSGRAVRRGDAPIGRVRPVLGAGAERSDPCVHEHASAAAAPPRPEASASPRWPCWC